MKRFIWAGVGVCLLVAVIWGGLFYWRNLRGAAPALTGPPQDIARLMATTGRKENPASPDKNYRISFTTSFWILHQHFR
jgi:hypothetical protein